MVSSAVAKQHNNQSGYKQTELGLIPEDWNIEPLSAICSYINDGTHYTPNYVEQGVPFFSVENVTANNFTDTKFISHDEHERLIKRCKPERGDILMTRIGSLGDTKLIDWDVNASIYVSLALLKLNSKTDPRYFYSYSKSPLFVKEVEKRSLINASPKKINMGDIGAVPVLLPSSTKEQEAIAEALSDADALIESLEQLIAKKRQIKQGAMQKLFANDDFEYVTLETIAKVIDPHPSHRAPEETQNGIPFVGIGDIDENGKLIGNNIRQVDESILNEHSKRYNFKNGLLGLGRVASIGKVINFPLEGNDFAVSPTMGVIQPAAIPLEYLFQILKSRIIKDQFEKIMSGSTRSSVGMIVLRKLLIPIPKLPNQAESIAQILTEMDSEISALEQKLDKAKQVKQGMMQDLLTGKVRLV